MTGRRHHLKFLLPIGLVAATMLALANGLPQDARQEFVRTDPEKVVLAEACGECHRSAFSVWSQTAHAKGFDELHRKESALEIAKAMGFPLVKRESLCLKCHYTPVIRRGKVRAGAGVTCESCHGAAQDWINVHNTFGVQESDFQKAYRRETADHRVERLQKADAAGMLRPSNLYAIAANCYQCHTVPHEDLVNVGRHSTGSAGFELLEWSQGEIRHNFLDSFLNGDGAVNAELPPERKRLLYFVGRALDLEYSLRGVAEARVQGRYVKAMVRRYRRALDEMQEIESRVPSPEVSRILAAVRGVAVKLGNRQALVIAADTISQAARRFLAQADGSRLAALEPLFSGGGDQRRAEAAEPDTISDETANTEDPVAATSGTAADSTAVKTETPVRTTDSAPSPDRPAKDQPASAAPTPQAKPPGRVLRRPPWHAAPTHRSIGPEECAGCHEHSPQDEWWLDDAHYTSADPLLDNNPKTLEIARLYGISADQMKRGNQICMQCHGSVLSGRESRRVGTGVGCESCHGGGADFKEPHQDGRDQALANGMFDLLNLKTRAQTCAKCHYINDARLLSVGHPSGEGFDLAKRTAKIQHWEHALADAASLKIAYRQVVAARGPLPSVTRIVAVDRRPTTAPTPTPSGGPANTASAPSTGTSVSTAPAPTAVANPGGDTPIGASPLSPAAAGDLPPTGGQGEIKTTTAPGAPPSTGEPSVEEALLQLKQRIEQLFLKIKSRRPRR